MAAKLALFMVVAAYPLAKIGLLLMKQLSKPVANFIKNEAKKHPQVRKYVIVPTGRAFAWAEYKIAKGVKGSQRVERPAVSEEEAVETGANALGEMILFGLLCIILLLEYNRQSDKKAQIERNKADEFASLQDVVYELADELERLKKNVRSIEDELESAQDVITLEERSHVQVHDYNFLDFLISKKPQQKDPVDVNSPSV